MMPDRPHVPVFDGHNDTLVALHLPDENGPRSFFERSERGHIDLPRALEGAFAGGFFAICLPPSPDAHSFFGSGPPPTDAGYDLALPPPLAQDYALDLTNAVIDDFFRIEAESRGWLKIVRNAGELRECFEQGVIAAVLEFEGAEPIDADLGNLAGFYDRGLRSLAIAWSRPNDFATGVPFRFPGSPDTGPGLTAHGRELVRACNKLGIMLDLSHLNERGFWDVAAFSEAPLAVTHTAAHVLCASTRNLTDRQVDAVGESDGIVGVAFHVGNLRSDGHQDADTPLMEIVRHVDYIASRIGIDHVAFGSDFDGAIMPLDLRDVAGLPRLIDAFRAHGFDEPSLQKVARENWMRLLKKTWHV
jgi:membrane dipeptidase